MNKKNNVIIVSQNTYSYNKRPPFRPAHSYPETPFCDLNPAENEEYDMVREGFYLMGLDTANYGKKEWNPLGEVIIPGNTVVLKPNMVMDFNANETGGTDCLYTQPSIVAAVLDYVIIALKGKGEIIVGDAPMQECNFEKLIDDSGYLKMIKYLKGKLADTEILIKLVDFRGLRSVVKDGIHYSVTDRYNYSGLGAQLIDLGDDSEFAGQDNYTYDNIRITNYDPALLKQHHNALVNEYMVSKEILMADVIINMPKPKMHRKGGVTIALKNLVGINCRKEYLPHHTKGSVQEGGDEYLYKSFAKRLGDYLLDKRNYNMQTSKKYLLAKLYSRLFIIPSVLYHFFKKDPYIEGSWYGNDTISRTIVDLNKILLYANKEGVMQSVPQRKVLIVADMIISGEKEGPVAPSPKNVGMITMGIDPVCFDETIATLMGAKMEFIHTITRARSLKSKYAFTDIDSEPLLVSNDGRYNNKKLSDLSEDDLLYFIPTTGWTEAFKTKN